MGQEPPPAPEDEGAEPPAVPPSEVGAAACRSSEEPARAVLATYCGSCHGGGYPDEGDFVIYDAEQLVHRGLIVPDDPERSPLYESLRSGAMPPAGEPQPSEAERDLVRDWIACGAPAVPYCPAIRFTDIDTRLEEMLDDVRDLATPEERRDVRYLELYPLAHAGLGAKEVEAYRDALDELASDLAALPLVEVGNKRLLLRLRLSEQGMSAEEWSALVADYPYAVRYDPDSERFPFDEEVAEALRAETGTAIPAVQADWFLAHTARSPLSAGLSALRDAHAAPLARQDVAAVLGLPEEELKHGLVGAESSALVELLREPDATISRAMLDAEFATLVRAIGLGEPIVTP